MEADILLKALAEPMRFRIVRLLLERKHCVRSLAKTLGVTESAVSQHLRVLREAGLVDGERCVYHIHYFPRQEAFDLLAGTFAAMRKNSLRLDRDASVCHCEFRRERHEKTD